MSVPEQAVALYECGSCGNVAVGGEGLSCCGDRMEPVEGVETRIDDPTLEGVLRSVFGMSETELDVCLCVMEAGATTAGELADDIDYDRSVVSRHLNHLAELGVLEKRRRILDQGGQVFVYTPVDRDEVRRNLLLGLSEWFRQGVRLVDGVSREKVATIVESEGRNSAAERTVYEG